MQQNQLRYQTPGAPAVAERWSLERLTSPSQMFGANGLRAGPDGRIYVAECIGSRISALDVDTGELETISPVGADIISPDDLDFDRHGTLYATEFMEGRVSTLSSNGRYRVLNGDLPAANGITFYQDRLFVDECRPGGRLLELDLDSGASRVLLEDLPFPNALAPGPDGLLYYPLIGPGEIWRVHPDYGQPERVVGGLNHPSAVKFDAAGFIVTTLPPTGEVLRIDPRNGARSLLASLGSPLDNLAFRGERLFVSHMVDGRISEVLHDGSSRDLLTPGLHGPLDLAVGGDGELYFADQVAFYVMAGDQLKSLGRIYDPHYPGAVRGVATLADREFAVTTASGKLLRYRPWAREYDVIAQGFDQLYGVAVRPDGALLLPELGTGRALSVKDGAVSVLATGLRDPMGAAVAADGTCLISEAGRGRVVKVTAEQVDTVIDGLVRPQGIAVRGSQLFIVDAGAQMIERFDMESGVRTTLARDLPVGAPPGVTVKPLRGCPPIIGPLGQFAGLAIGADGTLYFSADAEGSVMSLRSV